MREHDTKRKKGFMGPVHGSKEGASFQVIVLGHCGGPREDEVTGMLVRAPQSEWRKSSVIAVDAGAHLASIIRILEQDMPPSSDKIPPLDYSKVLDNGPFAGIRFPHVSAKANALYLFRELLHSFLITHPHLDHISGMSINTPALEYGREAKAIVALPSTIEAIKNHIFNDSIWPNLSDEGHGVGFVTYRRLIEGGNPRLGIGESRGYVNVCEGLATKCWSVSHGRCHRRSHSVSHQHSDSLGWSGNDYNINVRRMSRISDEHGYMASYAQQQALNSGGYPPAPPSQMPVAPGHVTPSVHQTPSTTMDGSHLFEPVVSSAFFIRNDTTGQELLVFGDIEPDSVSMSPRNHIVWEDAAPKIVHGKLKAIFIECSYDESVRNEDLYGHLCPRHLVAELYFLAKRVIAAQKQDSIEANHAKAGQIRDESHVPNQAMQTTTSQPATSETQRKRKRPRNGEPITIPEIQSPRSTSPASPLPIENSYVGKRSTPGARRKTSRAIDPINGQPTEIHPVTPSCTRQVQFQTVTDSHSLQPPEVMGQNLPSGGSTTLPSQSNAHSVQEKLQAPLRGLTVHIIHVKETLMDGPSPGDIILDQLKHLSDEAGLGATFNITKYGECIWV